MAGQSCSPLDKSVCLSWSSLCSRKPSGTFIFQNFCGSWKRSLSSLGGPRLLSRDAHSLGHASISLQLLGMLLKKVRGLLFWVQSCYFQANRLFVYIEPSEGLFSWYLINDLKCPYEYEFHPAHPKAAQMNCKRKRQRCFQALKNTSSGAERDSS